MEFTPKNRATVQNMPKLPYAVEEALNRLRVNVSVSYRITCNNGNQRTLRNP